MLLGLIYCLRYCIKEHRASNKKIQNRLQKEEEQRFIIEKIMMRDILEHEAWWDRFDRQRYIDYLEQKL